jgi:bacteriorhodopsin
VSDGEFQAVYNILSFTFAAMAASTIFFWLRLGSVSDKYKTALTITGMVTFIAAYHYFRIFNSWVEAYKYPSAIKGDGTYELSAPIPTGTPFNDAYRYMDWLLTVPLLLIEIILVMNLPPAEAMKKSWQLGIAAALMIILGYPGELILDDDHLSTRWIYWVLAMVPFCFVVYTLVVGLKDATNAEPNDEIRSKIRLAQWVTVISWLTYPIVFILPMLGLKGASAVVGIQCGYCVSDVVAKCGVGFIIYGITAAKSNEDRRGSLLHNSGGGYGSTGV